MNTNKELFSTLIKMADKLDQEGKFDLVAHIDKTLKTLATGEEDKMNADVMPTEIPESQTLRLSSAELDMLTAKGNSDKIAKVLASLGRAFELTKHPDGVITVRLDNSMMLAGGKGLYPNLDKKFKSMSKHASIEVEAARPKAPLKKVEDADFLNIYLIKADNKMKEVIKNLNDMFARLRFFNLYDAAKDIKLESLISEIERVEEAVSNTSAKFYEMSHGKRPGKDTFQQMVKDFEAKDPTTQSATDFFATQMAKDVPTKEDAVEEKEEVPEEEDISEDDLKDFWDNSTREQDDVIKGRMSPAGTAITDGTGTEGKEE